MFSIAITMCFISIAWIGFSLFFLSFSFYRYIKSLMERQERDEAFEGEHMLILEKVLEIFHYFHFSSENFLVLYVDEWPTPWFPSFQLESLSQITLMKNFLKTSFGNGSLLSIPIFLKKKSNYFLILISQE